MTVSDEQRTERLQVYREDLPPKLGVPDDPVLVRLEFCHQSTIMHKFDGELASTMRVSAMDVAHLLSQELSYSTGLLPPNALWWANTKEGPVFALWEPPKVRKLALQVGINDPPKRFTVPIPGLVFLCIPGQVPWVYAMKRRPTKLTDLVYRAPFCNIFESGRVCTGSHRFPKDPEKQPDSFFRSFFSRTADIGHRSAKFPQDVVHLWEFLDGKKTYPLDDLVKHGRVKDLMQMEMKPY